MTARLTAIALGFVLGGFSPGLTLAGPKDDITGNLRASATHQGQRALIEITSQEGWSCSGRAKLPETGKKSGKSGSKSAGRSSGGKAEALRLTCSDGSTARAEAKRDADRREWTIAFRHKDHGRAELRAREN